MPRYRVWAECITDCYLDVDAESEEEAFAIAEEADGGDFITDMAGGDFRVTSTIEKLEEE